MLLPVVLCQSHAFTCYRTFWDEGRKDKKELGNGRASDPLHFAMDVLGCVLAPMECLSYLDQAAEPRVILLIYLCVWFALYLLVELEPVIKDWQR